MFSSFFPRPKLFALTFIGWALICVIGWFMLGEALGQYLSLGGLLGYDYVLPVAEALAEGAKAEPVENPGETFWFYQYMLSCYAAFVVSWLILSPHIWGRWSVIGSAIIVFITWFQVQLDVMINKWFGTFYDSIQKALGEPNSISADNYYMQLLTFGKIALVAVTVAVFTRFFVSHYVFRWRTAINNYYTSLWPRVRHIEGASQRVQEDSMRFASIMEGLGVSLIDSIMTLIAFLPILWGLSVHVKALPIIGEVSQALVFVALIWSILGTAILALAGIKLPGLEFKNQRVEAAYRKELVYGEDDVARAEPPVVKDLFNDVRTNYFRLYSNYLYFNVVRYAYLQVGVLVPYIALAPTIIAGAFTLGVMQQIIRAFGRVESSFQYLVNSWTTIVELMSIYKRLKAFELAIHDQPLPDIEDPATEPASAG